MAGTEVLTGRMLEVAKNLEGLTARYNQSVDKMYQTSNEISGMWDGEASDRFMTLMANDRERFNTLTKMLTAYTEVLRQDVGIYVKAESDALGVVSR